MSIFNELPTTPQGDQITEAYWKKIEPDVNKVGDRMLDIYTDYKHDVATNQYKCEKCQQRIFYLKVVYGEIPFAVVISIFGQYLEGIVPVSVFDAVVQSIYENMPEELVKTVERLRFINTKYIERRDKLIDHLRGRGIAFKDNK